MSVFKISKVPKLKHQNDAVEVKPKSLKFSRLVWDSAEDTILKELMKNYHSANVNWKSMSHKMNQQLGDLSRKRTPKQLRERWNHHLNPYVNKNYWSENEDNILFSLQKNIGNKWLEIANFLEGRSDNSIKNYYYSRLRRQVMFLLEKLNNVFELDKLGIPERYRSLEWVTSLVKENKISFLDLSKESLCHLIMEKLACLKIPLDPPKLPEVKLELKSEAKKKKRVVKRSKPKEKRAKVKFIVQKKSNKPQLPANKCTKMPSIQANTNNQQITAVPIDNNFGIYDQLLSPLGLEFLIMNSIFNQQQFSSMQGINPNFDLQNLANPKLVTPQGFIIDLNQLTADMINIYNVVGSMNVNNMNNNSSGGA